jgi:hypothetical protein
MGVAVLDNACTLLPGTDWFAGDGAAQAKFAPETSATEPVVACVDGCLARATCVGFSANLAYPACYPKTETGTFIPRGANFSAGVCVHQ